MTWARALVHRSETSETREGHATLTVFVVVTHFGLGGAARLNGGLGHVGGALGADAAGGPGVDGVLVDAGGGLVLDGAVVASVDGEGGVVRGLDAGAVLAFGNVNGAGVVVVLVVLVYLDTGLGKVGAGGSKRIVG